MIQIQFLIVILHTPELKLNEELVNIYTWLCANKLYLNIEKYNLIFLYSFASEKVNNNIILKIFNKPIEQKATVKLSRSVN